MAPLHESAGGRRDIDAALISHRTPEDDANTTEVALRVRAALRTLCPRDRFLLEQYHLAHYEPTLQTIGDAMSLTRERVRQLMDRAEGRLRLALERLA